jgi:hypothetical protein
MKTVDVRIAVCVDSTGDYKAFGDPDSTDATLVAEATWGTRRLTHIVWVEAKVPVPVEPTPITVHGVVSDD